MSRRSSLVVRRSSFEVRLSVEDWAVLEARASSRVRGLVRCGAALRILERLKTIAEAASSSS
jgi:hypothetical protein